MDGALQKEKASLLASLTKAARNYYSNYGKLPTNARDLGKYTPVPGCANGSHEMCLNSAPTDYANKPIKEWFSTCGYYRILMKTDNNTVNFFAKPLNEGIGRGVSSCFNHSTNILKIRDMTKRGSSVIAADCTSE